MRAYGGKLSIAFRTGDRKLKFRKGLAGATDWAPAEVIDGKCCTSPVALELTSSGSPRVAFGDGTSRAEGLKFAVRTAKGWKKSKVHGGRIKHVAMTLNKLPGLFGEPPSNDPSIVFVVKKRGSLLATKGAGWFYRDLGKAFGPTRHQQRTATSPRSSWSRTAASSSSGPAAISGSPPS